MMSKRQETFRRSDRLARPQTAMPSWPSLSSGPLTQNRASQTGGVRRTSLSEIFVPTRQVNMSALLYSVKLSDILWVTIIILAGIWGGYIGTNNKGMIAPLIAGLLGTVIFSLSLIGSGAHHFPATEQYFTHMRKVFFAAFAALGVWLTIAFLFKPYTFLPNVLARAGILTTCVIFILHTLYYSQIRRLHNSRALAPNVVMLGATDSARRMIEENAKSKELNILAIFDDRLARAPTHIHGVPVVGQIDDLLSWAAMPYIDRIIVTLPSMAAARKKVFIDKVRRLPNRIAFVVDQFENLDHVQQRISQIAAIGVRDLSGKPRSGRHVTWKRLMDIAISATALTLGAPVLLLIAALIKLDSPGPILFKQKRHGVNNRIFEVYKFRSMRVEDEDRDAKQQVTAQDQRVTRLGRFLRKTSLDELPQLFNVLKGQMSLVGPRPHAVGMRTGNVESYKLVEEYAHRHKVKPGMTGWAQINGSRGPLHTSDDVARRVQLDIEYIERASIRFDFWIMLRTIPCLLGDFENIR